MPDALAALRAATAAQHAAVELSSGFDGAATTETYRDHLRALSAWLGEACAVLDGEDEIERSLASRVRTRLARLAADIAAVGACVPEADRAAASPPGPVTRAARLGVAYVVEGAQLGRAAVRGRIRALGHAPPARYLDAAEPNVWPRFVATLRAELDDEAAIADACRGAAWAFDRYAHWAAATRDALRI
jgi:heme oxygenase